MFRLKSAPAAHRADRTESVVALTVVTRNHLHFARAFGYSLRTVNPDIELVVCVVDGVADESQIGEPFRVVVGEQLKVKEWPRFRCQYLADELCYAVKPFFMEWAMTSLECSTLLYFDADILVYHPLDELVAILDAQQIALTPQLSSPAASRESELISRQYGVYNAGFVGVRNSEVGRAFVRWWQGWTHKHGVIDFGGSLACDQAWLDLVPGLFPDVHIERSGRYNLARWNLCERGLERSPDGTWTVGTEPLVFFHFSGFHVERSRDGSSVSWPGFDMHRFPLVKELCVDFADRLDECGAAETSMLPYRFARLSDGTEVEPLWREVVRMDHPELEGIEDPLNVETTPDLQHRFERAQLDARMCRFDWRAMFHEEQLARLRSVTAAPAPDVPF